nr:B176 [uncultured bacterium]
MARRRLLTREALARHYDPPTDEREIGRHFTLSREDLDLVGERRGAPSRLGFAIILLYMRWPGRVLEAGEKPPGAILAFVADQISVPATAFDDYARRDETRRTHLADLMKRFGHAAFDRNHFRAIVAFAMPVAQTVTQPLPLAGTVIDELRRRRVLLPPPAVIEAIVRRALQQAEQLTHEILTTGIEADKLAALDALLTRRSDQGATWLAWLRNAPQSPAARNILRLLERLDHVRMLGHDPARATMIPSATFDRLADEAVRITPQHLGELSPLRRHATLAAAAIRLEESLTDGALIMFDKLLGSMARRAENRTRDKAIRTVREMQGHLRALTNSCRVLIDAHAKGIDSFERIGPFDWDRFGSAVTQAEILVRPETIDRTAELIERHRTVKLFAGQFLQAFAFQGAGPVQGILDALSIIGDLYRTGKRRLPDKVPLRFVPAGWRAFVIRDGVVDRAAYELCALSQLRDRLRAGDIWVAGSRQFRDFDSYLIPPATFAVLREKGPLPLAIETKFDDHIKDRRKRLDDAIDRVTVLARQGELPQVRLDESGLMISPLKAITPPEAEVGRRTAYDRLPRVKITDILLDVDAWTGFGDCFLHRRSGRQAEDRNALLTVILADGINLGLTRMADSCQGASLRQLAHLHDWHISEAAYGEALGRLIEAHRVMPLAGLWGSGISSSSDGQQFHAGGRGAAISDINARNGNEPGVSFYTHISDQYDPFGSRVIAATAGEAPYVLDGLLYHQTGLSIEEHYTDTGGASDHVFGLMPFFGYRFAPRLRDIKERRLHLLPGQEAGPLLVGMVGDPIARDHAAAHWDELLRLATSIRTGTVTASAMLRKLSAYPRQNGLALALREIGRVERSIFMLDWLQDIDLRRRTQAGLNKGEARNALARALFFNQLGELRDRRFENLMGWTPPDGIYVLKWRC